MLQAVVTHLQNGLGLVDAVGRGGWLLGDRLAAGDVEHAHTGAVSKEDAAGEGAVGEGITAKRFVI